MCTAAMHSREGGAVAGSASHDESDKCRGGRSAAAAVEQCSDYRWMGGRGHRPRYGKGKSKVKGEGGCSSTAVQRREFAHGAGGGVGGSASQSSKPFLCDETVV